MTAPEPTRDVDRALVEAAEKALGCHLVHDPAGPTRYCATHQEIWLDSCPVAVAAARFAQERVAQAEGDLASLTLSRDEARAGYRELRVERDALREFLAEVHNLTEQLPSLERAVFRRAWRSAPQPEDGQERRAVPVIRPPRNGGARF